ncbi:hypothetical protein ACFE04_017728 [Oxalis oulophora]
MAAAALRNSVNKYLLTSSKSQLSSHLYKSSTNGTTLSYLNPHNSFITKKFRFLGSLANTSLNSFSVNTHRCKATSVIMTHSPSHFRNRLSFISISPILNHPSHSLSFSSKADGSYSSETASASNNSGSDVGPDLLDKVKSIWETTVDTTTHTAQKTKEAYHTLTPHLQQLLDSHPYLKDAIVPVSYTLVATLLAWSVMPKLLRTFHKYSLKAPASLSLFKEQVPYEKSFWGALEDPVRYFVTFITFTQIGMLVAPSTIASQYLTHAWRGAAVLSLIWFLHRWKTNVFSRVLASSTLARVDRDQMLTLDTLSSVGLFIIGMMAIAEECGVAFQSLLTVGGVGGVAIGFAGKDIIGNVLSGLHMQFAKSFSAGSYEGKVIEMGFFSTHLLSVEKFPIIVPNSLISSQAVGNKSLARCRAVVSKIPVNTVDLDKIPKISNDIETMLRSHSKVFLDEEAPCCYLSQVESSFAELTLAYNLKRMASQLSLFSFLAILEHVYVEA